jgi:hypothetical protein
MELFMQPVARQVLLAFVMLVCCAAQAGTNRTYFIGNSVTDQVKYDYLAQWAAARGHAMPWGRQMIPGAPLQWLWEHPGDGFTEPPYGYPTNALPNYEWDCLSLQPFDRQLASDTNHASLFIELALPHNSTMQVYVLSRWPRQGNFRPDFDGCWLSTYSGGWGYELETKDFFEKVLLALRNEWPGLKPILMVPCGDVLYALNQKMKAGAIAGYTNVVQVYHDGIHFNSVGQFVVGSTYYATLFKESPVGLAPETYGVSNAALAAAIQTTAWEVVRTHPLAGVIPEPATGVIAALVVGSAVVRRRPSGVGRGT